MPRASHGQAMFTPNWFSFRLRKYAKPPASDASNTEYATTEAYPVPMPSSRPSPWLM